MAKKTSNPEPEEVAGPDTTYLEITLPQEGIEANIVAVDAFGCEVLVRSIKIYPVFYSPKQVVNALYGSLKGVVDGEEIDLQRFVIAVSGRTGKCKVSQRTVPVTPFFSTGAVADDDDVGEDGDDLGAEDDDIDLPEGRVDKS